MAGEGKFIDNLMVGKTLVAGERQILISAQGGNAGATAGWSTATNTGSAKCAAGSTAATLKSNSVSNYEKENQKTKPLSEDIRQLQLPVSTDFPTLTTLMSSPRSS